MDKNTPHPPKTPESDIEKKQQQQLLPTNNSNIDKFTSDLCRAMVAVNIPLCALDENQKFRGFLEKYCNRAIPETETLRLEYMNQYQYFNQQDEEKTGSSEEPEQDNEEGSEVEETESLSSFDEVTREQEGDQENDESAIEGNGEAEREEGGGHEPPPKKKSKKEENANVE